MISGGKEGSTGSGRKAKDAADVAHTSPAADKISYVPLKAGMVINESWGLPSYERYGRRRPGEALPPQTSAAHARRSALSSGRSGAPMITGSILLDQPR